MMRLLRLWRLFTGTDLRLLWFALKHPRRPRWLWPATLLLAAFALDPFNVLMPLLGIVDDLVLLPLLLHGLVNLLPAPLRAEFIDLSGTASTRA